MTPLTKEQLDGLQQECADTRERWGEERFVEIRISDSLALLDMARGWLAEREHSDIAHVRKLRELDRAELKIERERRVSAEAVIRTLLSVDNCGDDRDAAVAEHRARWPEDGKGGEG